MTADLIMLFLYLLVHFIVVSMAVLIGLWLFYVTEWIINRLSNNPHENVPKMIYDERHDVPDGEGHRR